MENAEKIWLEYLNNIRKEKKKLYLEYHKFKKKKMNFYALWQKKTGLTLISYYI